MTLATKRDINGRKLKFMSNSAKGSPAANSRFAQLNNEAKKAGYQVGSGTCNCQVIKIGRSKSKGSVYKDYH